MDKVDIKHLHYADSAKVPECSIEDKRRLNDLGLWSFTNNNSFKDEPSIYTIFECAEILESYYGKITKYSLWACSVTGWRIVFGN
jgi:hypothetical protein